MCLSPTYNLALQRGEVAKRMGHFLPEIKIGYAVRGERGEEFCKKHNKTANPLHPTSV